MMIYATIANGLVINTAIYSSTPSDSTLVRIDTLSPQPNIGWSYNGTNFTAPVVAAQTPTQIYTKAVKAAMAFGQQLIIQFSVANVIAGITQAGQTQAVINYTSNLFVCLNSGSLYAAIADIEAMIADTSSTKTNLSPFITNDILYTYLNQIQTYLKIALTVNPGP